MMNKRVLVIVGSRPEGIKLAPVIMALKSSALDVKVCNTGQHQGMLDQVLDLFGIIPDYKLNIMSNNQTLESLTSLLIEKINKILKIYKPDYVLVQGDTSTAMCGALAGFYMKIPVAHVEAGLRSNDKYQPFPEEINRKIISSIAELHFCPTQESQANLAKENITKGVYSLGNTVVDALLYILNQNKVSAECLEIEKWFGDKRMVLVTSHRRENQSGGLNNICDALLKLANIYQENLRFVFPVHLNPVVKDIVNEKLKDHPSFMVIDPLSYDELVYLLSKAYIVLTDSGGIQEEAPSIKKPCFVFRNVTERPEGVSAGAVKLIGTEEKNIISEISEVLNDERRYNDMTESGGMLYGDGKTSAMIVSVLENNI